MSQEHQNKLNPKGMVYIAHKMTILINFLSFGIALLLGHTSFSCFFFSNR